MTKQEILSTENEVLYASDVYELLEMKEQGVREGLKAGTLFPFPCIKAGRTHKIPKAQFIRFMGWI